MQKEKKMYSKISYSYLKILVPLIFLFLLFGISTAGSAEGTVVINEVMFYPDTTDTSHYRNHEWVELFNYGDTVNIGAWVISNRDASLDAVLPNWDFPESTYLVVHFTTGVNDSDFSDGEGDYYAGSADVFSDSLDECALYTGPPSSQTIVDFLAWARLVNFVGGVSHSYAVSAGIWTSGDHFDAGGTSVPATSRRPIVLPGETVGRDKDSYDSDTSGDWDGTGGKDAHHETPGSRNLTNMFIFFRPPPPPLPPKDWTVMMYCVGDEDDNMEKWLFSDLNEIEKAGGSDNNVNFVFQYDALSKVVQVEISGGDIIPIPGTWGKTWRGYLMADANPDLVYLYMPPGQNCFLGEVDMDDPLSPNALVDYVNWAVANFPANNYALIISSHGGGWKGVAFDSTNGGDWIIMPELRQALQAVPHLNIIGFDACLMAMIEVGEQIRGEADILVASEEVIPGDGWPYLRWVPQLKANPGMSANQLSVRLVNEYQNYYEDKVEDYTLSATDLGVGFANLVSDVSAFAQGLRNGVEDYLTDDFAPDNVQFAIKSSREANPEEFCDHNYIDLFDFADDVWKNDGIPPDYKATAPQVKNDLTLGGPVIINEVHGESHPNAHGLSIYYPMDQDDPHPAGVHNSFDDPYEACVHPAIPEYMYAPNNDPTPPWPNCPPSNPNHPLPPTPNFQFVLGTLWDEFLLRYYEPVCDIHYELLDWEGNCGTFRFSGAGSSDADGEIVKYIWDFHSSLNSDADDWNRNCIDEFIDDREAEEMQTVQTFCAPFDETVTLTIWDDHYQHPGHEDHFQTRYCQVQVQLPETLCVMQQYNNHPQNYASWIWEGFQIAKFYNPQDYCEPPVYPYNISNVEFPLYKFTGAASEVNLQIVVYLMCEDSCDGPGPEIYRSDPYNITTFYPSWNHIVLPEPVCVFEPFYIALRWAAGPTPMPSMLMDNNVGMPGDSCHQWFYDPDVPAWYEHHSWWGNPEAVGVTMLRVSGYTNSPDCDFTPCDTAVDSLTYYNYSYQVWALPSASECNYPNERFTMPIDHGGRLERIKFLHYTMSGDPDPCYYVWLSDDQGHPWDNNPPYQAIASFCIPTENVNTYPFWTVIETWSEGIMFDPDEEFYVGYSFVFDPGDSLNLCGDDYTVSTSTRAGILWPTGEWKTMYEQYGYHMDWLIEAIICAEAPAESTFTIQCTPPTNTAVPGDPPAVKYQVSVGSVLGYNLPVTLSCTPPAGINVGFVNNPVTPPDISDVNVGVDALTPYGDYTLSFCGTGSDGQGPKCRYVTLTVQAPYDEAVIEFYHGKQRVTNFGAVGNDDTTENFVWYGKNYLFDGTFIVATTDADHMALDVYNCEHWGWTPTQHLNVYYDSNYNANIAYGNFFTTEDIISCEYDSVFFVGIMETCVEFSIKIKVYYNPTDVPIVHMYPALYEDWDVGDAHNDWGKMDPGHNLMWMYNPTDTNLIFGTMRAPFYDDPMYNMVFVSAPQYVYPNSGFCSDWGRDSLYWLISRPGYFPPQPPDTDFSILMTAPPIDLVPGIKHIEVWIDFGRNLNDGLSWSQWWHRVLRYVGFYRGDVNADDVMNITDVVYLINYLFISGPAPNPYADQGDMNADGEVNVSDVVYLINYMFIDGPAPIDYVRFIPSMWDRTSLFENPNWR
jgi:hypothetical protein